MLKKSLETIGTSAKSLANLLGWRAVVACVLGCTVMMSQLGSPMILLSETDAPYSESQDTEEISSETLCVAVNRCRSLARPNEVVVQTLDLRVITGKSATRCGYSMRVAVPDREFDHRNGVGAFLRC